MLTEMRTAWRSFTQPLTRLPVRPRISPDTAARLRDENLPEGVEIVALGTDAYRTVLRRMVELGLAGGVVYDALIAQVAEDAGVDRLVTLNERDFHRVWPAGTERIAGP